MFCAISGQVPEEPVISRKSGLLFEKRLIEKALTATGGKCPETGEHLSTDDLIVVKTSGKHARPITSSATSFPALMQHLQSEWDSLMVESHKLKKSLSKTKQELAHALYQYDAATRVISRLLKEKEVLRKTVVDVGGEGSSAMKRKAGQVEESNGTDKNKLSVTNGADGETDEPQVKRRKEENGDIAVNEESEFEEGPKLLSATTIESIEKVSESLRTRRKARKVSKDVAKIEDLKSFVDVAQLTGKSLSPTTCFLLCDDERAIAGYGDGTGVIFHPETLEMVENVDLQHGQALGGVTCLALAGRNERDIFVSGGGDGCVRVWAIGDSSAPRYTGNDSAGIVDIDVHPNNGLLFSCAENGSWTWRDMETNKVVSRKLEGRGDSRALYRSGKIHGDGVLFGTGCADGSLEMWDMRSMKSLARFSADWSSGNVGVSGMCMSENGFYLGSAINGRVGIWDLRKHKIAKEIIIEENGGPMNVCFDYSGLYGCAVSEGRHVVFSSKKKGGVVKEQVYEMSKKVEHVGWRRPGLAWYENAKALLTGQSNGEMHRYSNRSIEGSGE